MFDEPRHEACRREDEDREWPDHRQQPLHRDRVVVLELLAEEHEGRDDEADDVDDSERDEHRREEADDVHGFQSVE